MSKLMPMLAAAAALVIAGPAWAAGPTDQGAAQNVRESQQYEQLLHSNPAFRARRIQEECGPVADPQLHRQCVASFGPAPQHR